MRSVILKAAILALAGATYLASPFVTAWSIREAVRTGDSAYLERAIDWPAVRASLAPEIGRIALSLPAEVDGAKPGMWQRFKSYWGQGFVNRAVAQAVTPEGLPRLFQVRQSYRGYISGESDESRLPWMERARQAWSRVKRAEFIHAARFEVDMLDRSSDTRMFSGTLSLTTAGWKLTSLKMSEGREDDLSANRDTGMGNAYAGDETLLSRIRLAARPDR